MLVTYCPAAKPSGSGRSDNVGEGRFGGRIRVGCVARFLWLKLCDTLYCLKFKQNTPLKEGRKVRTLVWLDLPTLRLWGNGFFYVVPSVGRQSYNLAFGLNIISGLLLILFGFWGWQPLVSAWLIPFRLL